jgi:hypothetical protein
MNKTIYMTYYKKVPDIVFKRWKELNPNYNIDFSLDSDCISFLRRYFNDNVANLFINIKSGMYKADLWRLCKLYIYGGVYADVDLVPYIYLNELNKDITFYSCLSYNKKTVFQAFMMVKKPRSPLLLYFIISFLQNYLTTFPTTDMYNCLLYTFNKSRIVSEKIYSTDHIKIPIHVGKSSISNKTINLLYFPNDISYNLEPINETKIMFQFTIKNNQLYVHSDKHTGWDIDLYCNIVIPSKEKIFLFTEKNDTLLKIHSEYYVAYENIKLLQSRDPVYEANKGWK